MILGIAGSFGAGKGAVVAHLVSHHRFTHFSASGFITEEVERRELPLNRDSMILVANELRAAYGPSYIIDELYKRAETIGGDVVIESLRAVAEVRRIKELGGVVLGVDAEPKLRYNRSQQRGGVKDGVSYEKWHEQEQAESNTDDPNKQNIFGALAEADYLIDNNGTMEELHERVDEFLKQFQ